MRIMIGLLVAGMLALAGCATIDNPLSQQDIAALKISEVEVRFAPGYSISWLKAEQEFADKMQPGLRERSPQKEPGSGAVDQSDDPYLKAIKSPEGQAHIRNKLAAAIKDRVQRQITPKFSTGTRAVKLEVEVHGFTIPSAMQRIVIGGVPTMAALVYLRDAKTGAQLAKLDQGAAAGAGNGVLGVLIDKAVDGSELEDRLLAQWVLNVENWLLKKGA